MSDLLVGDDLLWRERHRHRVDGTPAEGAGRRSQELTAQSFAETGDRRRRKNGHAVDALALSADEGRGQLR